MNRVSIIVPVYNTKDYIIRCVDSLVNQTYKDIEIILVDDFYSFERNSSRFLFRKGLRERT